MIQVSFHGPLSISSIGYDTSSVRLQDKDGNNTLLFMREQFVLALPGLLQAFPLAHGVYLSPDNGDAVDGIEAVRARLEADGYLPAEDDAPDTPITSGVVGHAHALHVAGMD